jgi:hypothetical protein
MWLALAVATLLLGPPLFLVVAVVSEFLNEAPRYDPKNPDYDYVTHQVREDPAQRPEAPWIPGEVDLSKINGGDWQFVCVIGAYNDPAKRLADEAARRAIAIKKIDVVPEPALGITPVEEYEGAVSFIDGAGHGRTVLINGFERLACQHGWECYGKETNVITLPLGCK